MNKTKYFGPFENGHDLEKAVNNFVDEIGSAAVYFHYRYDLKACMVVYFVPVPVKSN